MLPMSDHDLDTRRKRIRYRSWHRGCKETDLIFGPFADAHVGALDAGQIARLEALLEETDADLFEWLTDKARPPSRVVNDIWFMLCRFKRDAPAP